MIPQSEAPAAIERTATFLSIIRPPDLPHTNISCLLDPTKAYVQVYYLLHRYDIFMYLFLKFSVIFIVKN
jgi:hypothetical protein